MIRKAVFTVGLGASLLVACVGPETGTTTTTAGVVSRAQSACTVTEAPCTTSRDCCSVWCVDGLCADREP